MNKPPRSTKDRASTDLLDLTPQEMREALTSDLERRGQPSYRADQIQRWIYGSHVRSFAEMTNLPEPERASLSETFDWTEPRVERVSRSEDGTAKHLWRLSDGELIESVLIPTRDRLTLCISSQAGCAMGCTFCATGWAGFSRQLTAGEIVSQFRAARRWAEAEGYGPVTNIVFMGMGEPLSNRSALHPALTILNSGFGIGARKITVSTVGVVPGIRELAARPEQFELALSLHSPVSGLRLELIPLEKRHPLPEVMEALQEYRRGKGRRISFEYTMIRGMNDARELADPLATLASSVDAFVNLIPYNPIPYREWEPSHPSTISHFLRVLTGRGVSAAVREPRGRDIDAACGQLRADALVQIESGR